ncbi:MAG: DNA methyltransferase [Balneolaceae bacterium]
MTFNDILYGQIVLPDWLDDFIKWPTFLRLREVRLSNIDSIFFKDFSNTCRWEHSIGVAYLAHQYCLKADLNKNQIANLCIAALLHDIATPPFAHTVENITNYDHEEFAYKILGGKIKALTKHNSQYINFEDVCEKVSRKFNLNISSEKIASIITGDDEDFGHLINNIIDLDNIDNVIRASNYMGLQVDKDLPIKLVQVLVEKNKYRIVNIKDENNTYLNLWKDYKNRLYETFYNQDENETAREAFLQHILRNAITSGYPQEEIIFNTDYKLLEEVSSINSHLRDLVEKYKSLKEPILLFELVIQEEEGSNLKFLNSNFISWIEKKLSSKYFKPIIIFSKKRFGKSASLFREIGRLKIYKIGSTIELYHFPKWVQEQYNLSTITKVDLKKIMKKVLKELSDKWDYIENKNEIINVSNTNVIENLDHIKDWGFNYSKNKSLHSYPSTYVHAIPATFVKSLNLENDLVLDIFGGTGQTASEAIKFGNKTISIDSNKIATMIAKTKFSYLPKESRKILASVKREDFTKLDDKLIPNEEKFQIQKWHNPKTLEELGRILTGIEGNFCNTEKLFLKTCFSGILSNATDRYGKGHNYFADNTPLEKGKDVPEYRDAFDLFFKKIRRNLRIIELFYSQIKNKDLDIEKTLSNGQFYNLDSRKIESKDIEISDHEVDAIITSPPYLCMTDYSLGQRLPYYWLYPNELSINFENEVGSRRKRTNPQKAKLDYFKDMAKIAHVSNKLLKDGGYIAMVIGEPVANAFKEEKILDEVEQVFEANQLTKIWENWRALSWHRNFSYKKINKEKLILFQNNI